MGEEAHAAVALQPVLAELRAVAGRVQPALENAVREAAVVAAAARALAQVGARVPCALSSAQRLQTEPPIQVQSESDLVDISIS